MKASVWDRTLATLWLGQSTPLAVRPAHADWPQFMGEAAHRGLARTEIDPAVLGLQHQVVLGEAILTSPAISGARLILPGAIGQPLAALDRATGRLLWRNDAVTELTLVHSPSILGDLMTVNTKYTGGAKCWDVTSGEPISVAADGDRSLLDLSGGGHTCSPIVMTAAGYAITATNKGIYATDLSTGKVVGKTPGFASQTCPHPIVADGRMFYSPQNNGMLYCFEPLPHPLAVKSDAGR